MLWGCDSLVEPVSSTTEVMRKVLPPGCVYKYEAESEEFTPNAIIQSSIAGYSGTGYVSQRTGDVIFNISICNEGKYIMRIRYTTNSSTNKKYNNLVINNQKITSLTFNAGLGWSNLDVKVFLQEGANTIKIEKDWGYTYIDYLEIIDTADDTPFNLSTNLATSGAKPQAVNLYNYLKQKFGQEILSGAMANYSTGIEEATWMYDQTGLWPALTTFDFINYTRSWSWVDKTALETNAKQWWNNNGIVSIMWHWRDPSWITNEFYTSMTNFDVSKITDVNSNEYAYMIRDIDIIAQYLKRLQNDSVPVLWRPLHESSGAWFWWGAKGSASFKQLWQLMFTRLRNYHGVKNLIWVWTPSVVKGMTDAEIADWYPGDAFVDVIGLDIYPGANQHGSQYFLFDRLKDVTNGEKIISLSECGSVPTIDNMFMCGDKWSWYMPWNGDYTRSDTHNGAQFFNSLFNHPNVITRDEVPNLKN